MKYLKTFEIKLVYNIINKVEEYQKKDKIVIIKYKNILYIAKIINIYLHNNCYYSNIEYYDWDNFDNGYNVYTAFLPLNKIIIIDSFDNISDAQKLYDIIITSKKYNL